MSLLETLGLRPRTGIAEGRTPKDKVRIDGQESSSEETESDSEEEPPKKVLDGSAKDPSDGDAKAKGKSADAGKDP